MAIMTVYARLRMSAETLRTWVHRSDEDAGETPEVLTKSAREIRGSSANGETGADHRGVERRPRLLSSSHDQLVESTHGHLFWPSCLT